MVEEKIFHAGLRNLNGPTVRNVTPYTVWEAFGNDEARAQWLIQQSQEIDLVINRIKLTRRTEELQKYLKESDEALTRQNDQYTTVENELALID